MPPSDEFAQRFFGLSDRHGDNIMDDSASTVLAMFAYGLADGGGDGSPLACAQERGWLDADGRPTADGLELANALSDQTGTRSALRVG